MILLHCLMVTSGFPHDISLFLERGIGQLLGEPFAAPVFMFTMGVGMVYSKNQDPGYLIKRGIRIMLLGLVVNVGEYTITIDGRGDYAGTTKATYTIKKAKNPMTLKAKTVEVKYKGLKNKSKSIKRANAFTVSKAEGTPSNKLVSSKKDGKSFKTKFRVNTRTGKVTVKKGLKTGTYKVKVSVKAKGNANYKASGWKPVTFTVKEGIHTKVSIQRYLNKVNVYEIRF